MKNFKKISISIGTLLSLASAPSFAQQSCESVKVEFLKEAPIVASSIIKYIEETKSVDWLSDEYSLVPQYKNTFNSIKTSFDVVSSMTPEMVNKNCNNIKQYLTQSIKLNNSTNNAIRSLADIIKNKDQIKVESKCNDVKSCNLVLNQRLLLAINPDLAKSKISYTDLPFSPTTTTCPVNKDKYLSDVFVMLENKKKFLAQLSESDWIDTKTTPLLNLYNSINVATDFYKKVKLSDSSEYNSLCNKITGSIPTISKLDIELVSRTRAIEMINQTQKILVLKSGCKNDNSCNSMLNNKFEEKSNEIISQRTPNK